MERRFAKLIQDLRSKGARLTFTQKRGLRVSEPSGGLSDEEREALRELASELRLGHVQPGEVGLWEGRHYHARDAADRTAAMRQARAEFESRGIRPSRATRQAAVRLHTWLARRWPRHAPGWIPEEEARFRLTRIYQGCPAHIDPPTNEVVLDGAPAREAASAKETNA